jgi:putative oxidoreductase
MVYRFYRALRSGAPFVLSLLRIVTALVLMEHGTQKLIDFPPMPRFAGLPGVAAGAVPGSTGAIAPTQAGAAVGARANAVPGRTPGAVAQATPVAPAVAGATSAAVPQGNAAGARPAGAGGARGGGPAGGGPGGGGGFRGPPAYLFPIAGWIETVAGGLLVVGLFTRSAAFLLSGETAVVYFIAHAPMSLFPALNGGAEPALFAWTFLYVFFAGPGPLSLDALWRRMRRRGAVGNEPVVAAG